MQTAGIATVTADLVSFTRSKGIYGGVNLDGTVVHANTKFNGEFYGGGKEILPPDLVMRAAHKSPKAASLLSAVGKIAGI